MPLPLLRMGEVAEILSISTERAYQLGRDGRLPVVRIGKHVRVNPEALKEWMDAGGSPLDDAEAQESNKRSDNSRGGGGPSDPRRREV